MAYVSPLYWDEDTQTIREMSTADVAAITARAEYLMATLYKPRYISVYDNDDEPGADSCLAMMDTRLIAGSAQSGTAAYPNPPNTTVKYHMYDRGNMQGVGTSQLIDPKKPAYLTTTASTVKTTKPLYLTELQGQKHFREMPGNWVIDTFFAPLRDKLLEDSDGLPKIMGHYTIGTSDTVLLSDTSNVATDFSLVSSNPFFINTRSMPLEYTTPDEPLDQFGIYEEYYLWQKTAVDPGPLEKLPLVSRLSTPDRLYTVRRDRFDEWLGQTAAWTFRNAQGYRYWYQTSDRQVIRNPIVYSFGDGPLQNRQLGSDIIDDRYATQRTIQKFINADNYRAQDVPDSDGASPALVHGFFKYKW